MKLLQRIRRIWTLRRKNSQQAQVEANTRRDMNLAELQYLWYTCQAEYRRLLRNVREEECYCAHMIKRARQALLRQDDTLASAALQQYAHTQLRANRYKAISTQYAMALEQIQAIIKRFNHQ